MQKFVVPKKFNNSEQAKVKMSGYLKKKRNKVGGWRKMWFVLQNQLLLSYSSKEEYEKKLIPFKDVLNLVPGTVVRPCGGFRFTIETTTNIIFTFRCDDSKTCTEWITALVESLTMQGQCAKENGVGYAPQFHISLENIRQIGGMVKRPVQASCSWDSICSPKNPKSPKLPIIQSTARLLERSGGPSSDSNRTPTQSHPNENPDRARNFRLHEKNSTASQSDEVFRINQMFNRSAVVAAGGMESPGSGGGGGLLVRSNVPNSFSSDTDSGLANSVLRDSGSGSETGAGYIERIQEQLPLTSQMENSSDKLNFPKMYEDNTSPRDLNQNRMFDRNISSLEEQIRRLGLNDLSGSDTVCFAKTKSFDIDSGRIYERIESPVTFSSSSPDTSYEHKMHARLSASTDNVCQTEPIYAVVDLKTKYARRAKLLEMEEQMQRERPKSIHVVTSDYEEVLNFSTEYSDKDEDENENIYEPINIPDCNHHHHHHHHNHSHHHHSHNHNPNHNQRNIVWRYLPKINLESIIEMARHKKKDNNTTKTDQHSPFSDIRRRFGNHRKSIKNRMKRFYIKERPNTIVKERNAFSDDELDSQGATGSTSGTSDNSIKSSCGHIDKSTPSLLLNEIDKYRRGEKHIFGSLSRLKKARTSLCLDDSNSKKNFVLQQNNPIFQHELRQEINRRSGRKKVECHSKFYD